MRLNIQVKAKVNSIEFLICIFTRIFCICGILLFELPILSRNYVYSYSSYAVDEQPEINKFCSVLKALKTKNVSSLNILEKRPDVTYKLKCYHENILIN